MFVIPKNRHLYVNKIIILSYMDNADSSSGSGQWAKSKHLRCSIPTFVHFFLLEFHTHFFLLGAQAGMIVEIILIPTLLILGKE